MEAHIVVLQSKHDNVTKMDDKTPILMMSSHGRQTTPCSSPSALDRKFRGVHGLNHRHCIYRGCRCDLLLVFALAISVTPVCFDTFLSRKASPVTHRACSCCNGGSCCCRNQVGRRGCLHGRWVGGAAALSPWHREGSGGGGAGKQKRGRIEQYDGRATGCPHWSESKCWGRAAFVSDTVSTL